MKTIKSVNEEIKKMIGRVKDTQAQLQGIVKSQDWVDEARKYAERQGKEVKKLFAPDVEKMKDFLVRERQELERFQKQIPIEVKKVRQFVSDQKREFERLVTSIRKLNKPKKKAGLKKAPKKAPKRRTKKKATTSR